MTFLETESEFSSYPRIDYSLIGSVIEYYRALGYAYIEVPWIVPKEIANITCSDDEKILLVGNNCLVGSAEQSLIHLLTENKLPLDIPFVACTPCHRLNEPNTPHHFPQFMKVELGLVMSSRSNTDVKDRVISMLRHAQSFMLEHTNKKISEVTSSAQIDLEIEGIEVGSYGFRILPDTNIWCYGTGLAEPRFSMVK